MKVYPRHRLQQEMAFLAYYFHWGRDELMNLDHLERRRWCKELSRINREQDDAPERSLEDLL